MKPKVINSILCKKFDAWVATITDPEFAERVRSNTICTGGAITSMLLGEMPNDYDFYFRDYQTTKMAADYYLSQFLADHPKPQMGTGNDCEMYVDVSADLEQVGMMRVKIVVKSVGVASKASGKDYQYFEGTSGEEAAEYIAKVTDGEVEPSDIAEPKKGKSEPNDKAYTAKYLTSNAITLRDSVQIVLRFYGEPAQIHSNYDFVHATNVWTSWDRQLTFNTDALLATINKELRYVGSKYPLASLFRVRKFMKRGWTITAGQMLRIAVNLQQYNLCDVAVLESQLTGVDVAYFNQLIAEVKKVGAERVDSTYIMQLIESMV